MRKLKQKQSRRNFLIGSLSTFASGLLPFNTLFANATTNKNTITPKARLGINLSGIADWGTEQPFVDMFKASRDWFGQSTLKNAKWGDGAKLELDESGWVKSLPKNTVARRMISTVKNGHYPSGKYVLLYDGEGELKPSYAGKVHSKSPGRMVIDVDASKGDFWLDLIKTNPRNYVKNIRFIMPGFEAVYMDNPWNPKFIRRWSGIACIRMMDFMRTNNSEQTHWNDRPKVHDASYKSKGVPVELMVDLVNRIGADVWFCMPHQADDLYIKSFAAYVNENLKPSLRAWVEYSNEVWNGQFKQSKYAVAQGKKLNLAKDDSQANHRFVGYQSERIFNIWNSIFSKDESRIVKVLPAFAAYTGVAKDILNYKSVAKQADVIAIANYIGTGMTGSGKKSLKGKEVSNWTLDKLFDYLNKVMLLRANEAVVEHKKLADKYNLKLVAYEAGQHLVGHGDEVNNKKLTKLYTAANQDPRMGKLYHDSLEAWEQAGGDLICAFLSVEAWSKWGSWGLLQYNDEDPKKSPKFSAVIEWAKQQGQKMGY